jgi:hypothetical protein
MEQGFVSRIQKIVTKTKKFLTSKTGFTGLSFLGHNHRAADCPGHGISSSQGDRAQGPQDQGEQRLESGCCRIRSMFCTRIQPVLFYHILLFVVGM